MINSGFFSNTGSLAAALTCRAEYCGRFIFPNSRSIIASSSRSSMLKLLYLGAAAGAASSTGGFRQLSRCM